MFKKIFKNLNVYFQFILDIFDIYVDIPPNQRIWIIDFNPWHSLTNLLLFQDFDFS